LISTSTLSRIPASRAAISICATCAASSAHTAIRAMRCSAASRASLLAPITSLLTRMSATPPQASASASPTFCTHCPTAPRRICCSAMIGDLCVLACARSFAGVPATSAAIVSRL
jgi:hypothetical protein